MKIVDITGDGRTIISARDGEDQELPNIPGYKRVFDVVLIDIKGQDERSTDPDEACVRRILESLVDCPFPPSTIVAVDRDRTQVCLSLPEPIPSSDGKAFFKSPYVRNALFNAFLNIRRAMGRGGRLDRSKWNPSGWAILPGWRVGSDGKAVCARLWWTSEFGMMPKEHEGGEGE